MYGEIGNALKAGAAEDTPYQGWIDTYSGSEYQDVCTNVGSMIDKAVAAARERGLRKPLTCETYGYAVFGRVVEGMDVVQTVEIVETEWTDDFDDLPVEPVVIRRIRRLVEE